MCLHNEGLSVCPIKINTRVPWKFCRKEVVFSKRSWETCSLRSSSPCVSYLETSTSASKELWWMMHRVHSQKHRVKNGHFVRDDTSVLYLSTSVIPFPPFLHSLPECLPWHHGATQDWIQTCAKISTLRIHCDRHKKCTLLVFFMWKGDHCLIAKSAWEGRFFKCRNENASQKLSELSKE